MVSQFPFGQDFVVLRDAMNQLLEESFVPSRGSRSSGSNGTMVRPLPLDVYATQDEAVIIAAVPGMSPQYLEVRLKFSPYIQDIMTIGGFDMPYVTAIVVINFDNVARWAEKQNIAFTTMVDLSQRPEVVGT